MANAACSELYNFVILICQMIKYGIKNTLA